MAVNVHRVVLDLWVGLCMNFISCLVNSLPFGGNRWLTPCVPTPTLLMVLFHVFPALPFSKNIHKGANGCLANGFLKCSNTIQTIK